MQGKRLRILSLGRRAADVGLGGGWSGRKPGPQSVMVRHSLPMTVKAAQEWRWQLSQQAWNTDRQPHTCKRRMEEQGGRREEGG